MKGTSYVRLPSAYPTQEGMLLHMFFCWIGKVVIVKNEGKILFGNTKILSVNDTSTSNTGAGESTEQEEETTNEVAVQILARKRSRRKRAPRGNASASKATLPYLAPKLRPKPYK